MKYQGTCLCGRIHIGILSEPIMKYNCHCSHCRAFASKGRKPSSSDANNNMDKVVAYHSAAFVWRWSVIIVDTIVDKKKVSSSTTTLIEYEETTSLFGLFGLSRGRCKFCLQPIWEKGKRLALLYAMVMIPPLQNIQPDTNLFYNSGVVMKKKHENAIRTEFDSNNIKMTTIYTDWGSWIYEVWIVLTVGIPLLPSSILAFFVRKWNLSIQKDK